MGGDIKLQKQHSRLSKKKKKLTLKLKLTKMTYAVVKHMQRICPKSVTHKICVIHPLIIGSKPPTDPRTEK